MILSCFPAWETSHESHIPEFMVSLIVPLVKILENDSLKMYSVFRSYRSEQTKVLWFSPGQANIYDMNGHFAMRIIYRSVLHQGK